MIELTDEIILKIDNLLDDWASLAVKLGRIAHTKEKIPTRYANDDILVEYFNGIKDGKTVYQMREIYLPKYIRKELKQLKITK